MYKILIKFAYIGVATSENAFPLENYYARALVELGFLQKMEVTTRGDKSYQVAITEAGLGAFRALDPVERVHVCFNAGEMNLVACCIDDLSKDQLPEFISHKSDSVRLYAQRRFDQLKDVEDGFSGSGEGSNCSVEED